MFFFRIRKCKPEWVPSAQVFILNIFIGVMGELYVKVRPKGNCSCRMILNVVGPPRVDKPICLSLDPGYC